MKPYLPGREILKNLSPLELRWAFFQKSIGSLIIPSSLIALTLIVKFTKHLLFKKIAKWMMNVHTQ
jgi:hypothetical protein